MSRLTTDLIDRQLRDKTDTPAFPEETHSYLNVALESVEGAVVECRDLLEKEVGPATPVGSCEAEQWPGWEFLGKEEKLAVIEGVIAADIRPYIELDAGGVQVIDLVGGKELLISYQGACTTCYSSTGATLQAIQGILQAKVSSELVVVPDFS
jgi:NifU-like protein